MVPAVLLALVLQAGVVAAAEDDPLLSMVGTGQVWFSIIEQNGFLPPSNLPVFNELGQVVPQRTKREASTSTFSVQPGGQAAIQYGRWSLGVAYQFVSFKTEDSHIATENFPIFVSPPPVTVSAGEELFKETWDITRQDVDVALTYFFPDVITDRLDLSVGLGFKWIGVKGDRRLSTNQTLIDQGVVFVYTNLPQDASNANTPLSVREDIYAATIPLGATFNITQDGRWRIPFNMSFLLGHDSTRDSLQDKTFNSFAWGGTGDIGVRYVFEKHWSLYAGYRAQGVVGNNDYLAHGPLISASLRF